MELITLEIQGKFAHFRKFYGNNTALSYTLPPRTTITGIFAAILGKERGSYHQDMASDRLRIGVGIVHPVKKSFHRLNNLMIKGGGDFRGRQGPVQTPFEMVTPVDLRKNFVTYKVFLSAYLPGEAIFNEIATHLLNRRRVFNISLGTAFCHAQLKRIEFFADSEWRSLEANGEEWLRLNSAVMIQQVEQIQVSGTQIVLEEEILPGEFIADNDRELKSVHKVLFSTSGHDIAVKLKGEYYQVADQYFTFLES